jgi:hypothetical protein
MADGDARDEQGRIEEGPDKGKLPEAEPGDRSKDPSPHHVLNNPVGEPDPTEWPDPYDTREDPRAPEDPDGLPFGEEPHPQNGSLSTSEPHPKQDPEVPDRDKNP